LHYIELDLSLWSFVFVFVVVAIWRAIGLIVGLSVAVQIWISTMIFDGFVDRLGMFVLLVA